MVDDRIAALDGQCWRLRYTDRDRLREAVVELLRLAPPGSVAEATAHFHRAVWAWQADDLEQSRAARALAARAFERLGDVAGIADCRDLEAIDARLSGDLARAADLCRINGALPDDVRPPAGRCITAIGEGAIFLAMGRHDECQRAWSIALSLAEKSDNPGLEVSALCNLGAWNIAVCNFEDGHELSRRGFDLAARGFDPARPDAVTVGWMNSGMNLVVALDCLGRHDEARVVVDRLLLHVDSSPRAPVANYYVTFASAVLHAGEVERADEFLRRSRAAGPVLADFALELSIVQAEIWNARGQHARTRALCEGVIGREQAHGRDVSAHDLMRLYNAATVASEAFGDFETALRHQQAARARYEELAGGSARARRLTFEIGVELQRAEWQRDRALALRHAAEREQARLAELNAALEAASAAKSRFLAAVSHDLRQPVMAVGLLADALAQRLAEPELATLSTRIVQSADTLSRLLSELLEISELDAGATAAQVTAFPVAGILAAIDTEFRDAATARGLELRLAAADAWIASDPTHLLRILRNLVANALACTTGGGVLLVARARRDVVLLEVWDTGVGIDGEHLPHVFDEFYQVGNRARDRRRGLGLGLTIVRRLAHLLGHRVEIRSRPGRGTCVRITLPRVALPATAGSSAAG